MRLQGHIDPATSFLYQGPEGKLPEAQAFVLLLEIPRCVTFSSVVTKTSDSPLLRGKVNLGSDFQNILKAWLSGSQQLCTP